MNRLFAILLLVITCVVVRAASPTFENFDQRHFRTNGALPGIIETRLSASNFDQNGTTWTITNISGATGATLWTNDLSISGGGPYGRLTPIPGLNYRYIYPSNSYMNGWFGLEPNIRFLSLGANAINTTDYSSWILFSPTNDASQVTMTLTDGIAFGQNLIIMSMTNTPMDGRFTLAANSAVPGGGVVKLNNDMDWLGANGSSLQLIWMNPDWWEVGRWTAGTNGAGNNGVIGSGTNPYLPYWVNSTTLGNSPVLRVDATTIGIGSSTNTLSPSGIDLIYEGSSVIGNGVAIGVKRGASTAYFSVTTAGAAQMQGTGRAQMDVGSSQAIWDGLNLFPSGTGNLGSASNPWTNLWFSTGAPNGVFLRSGSGTPEGVVGASIGSLFVRLDGGSGTTLYSKTSGTGNTGWEAVAASSGAANWTADGTTNSTLAGIASANGGVFTNGLTAGASTFTGTVELRNGVTPMTNLVYNTWSDAANYERGIMSWAGNVLSIGGDKLGSGASRRVQFVQGGTNIFYIDAATGALLWNTDNSRDIGASGATRPKDVYIAGTYRGTTANLTGEFISGTGGGGGFRSSSGGGFYWNTRSVITSSADGAILFRNTAGTDFDRLQFGGATTNFPALKSMTNAPGLPYLAVTDATGVNLKKVVVNGVQGGQTNVLSDAAATSVFYVSVPDTNIISGKVIYEIFATDGTDAQGISGDVKFVAVGKGTGVTAQIADVQTTAAVSAGTLTCTVAANVATNNIFALTVNADTSLTTTNLVAKWRVEAPTLYDVYQILP